METQEKIMPLSDRDFNNLIRLVQGTEVYDKQDEIETAMGVLVLNNLTIDGYMWYGPYHYDTPRDEEVVMESYHVDSVTLYPSIDDDDFLAVSLDENQIERLLKALNPIIE
jgi:hypothetical protein